MIANMEGAKEEKDEELKRIGDDPRELSRTSVADAHAAAPLTAPLMMTVCGDMDRCAIPSVDGASTAPRGSLLRCFGPIATWVCSPQEQENCEGCGRDRPVQGECRGQAKTARTQMLATRESDCSRATTAWVHMHGCTCHPNKTVRGKTRVLCQLGDMAMWARKGGDRAITHLCANHVM